MGIVKSLGAFETSSDRKGAKHALPPTQGNSGGSRAAFTGNAGAMNGVPT
jgi:hypothetical protein